MDNTLGGTQRKALLGGKLKNHLRLVGLHNQRSVSLRDVVLPSCGIVGVRPCLARGYFIPGGTSQRKGPSVNVRRRTLFAPDQGSSIEQVVIGDSVRFCFDFRQNCRTAYEPFNMFEPFSRCYILRLRPCRQPVCLRFAKRLRLSQVPSGTRCDTRQDIRSGKLASSRADAGSGSCQVWLSTMSITRSRIELSTDLGTY